MSSNCGGETSLSGRVAPGAKKTFDFVAASAAILGRAISSGKSSRKREAGNHRLGLVTVKYPACATVKPRRTTERRIFIASPSMILGGAYAFASAISRFRGKREVECDGERQPQILRLDRSPLRAIFLRMTKLKEGSEVSQVSESRPGAPIFRSELNAREVSGRRRSGGSEPTPSLLLRPGIR